MRHSVPLKVAATVSLLFGVSLVFAPNWLMSMYRAPALTGPGEYNSMLLGAALLALGFMYWVASDVSALEARVVVLGGIVANGLGFLVALYRQLFSDAAVPRGWLTVALYLAFALMFLWLQRAARSDAVSGAMAGDRAPAH